MVLGELREAESLQERTLVDAELSGDLYTIVTLHLSGGVVLALARKMLAGKPGAKQVIVITDGEPTAHVLDDGEVFFHYPPVPETLQATYGEVVTVDLELGTGVVVSPGICNGFQATGDGITEYAYCFDHEWEPVMDGVALALNGFK